MRTIIDLSDEQIDLLKRLSKQTRLSRAELVRRAVAEYLRQHQSNDSESAFGIWRHKREDGLDCERNLREEWGA